MIVCEVCGRVVDDAAHLIVHYETAHPPPGPKWTQPQLPFETDRVHRVGQSCR